MFGRAQFVFGKRTLAAGAYTIVVYPKWGCWNENSCIDQEVFGTLLVDLYYPTGMGHTEL